MKTITIKSPQPKDGKIPTSEQTKVLMGGTPIHGIRSIRVRYDVDQPITAVMQLFAWPGDVTAAGEFIMQDPLDGERKTIKKIEYTDGSTVDLD